MNFTIFIVLSILLIAGGAGLMFLANVEEEHLESESQITVFTPQTNQVIESPLLIEGEARGTWFFEADFPIKLTTEDGTVIATAIAQAQGEWMTSDFVSFKVQLEFEKPTGVLGLLVFEKDNPSGLQEHADELRVPIRFF